MLASGAISKVDARDAILAADAIRFGRANQALLWNGFAQNGLGAGAASNKPNDGDPTPSFESSHANEAVVTFKGVGDAAGRPVSLFVGDYEGRATPVADTDGGTTLPDTFRIVAGSYRFVARGAGFGALRLTASFNAAQVRDLPVNMPRNLASATSGATATGDGINLAWLIDDAEATNWASLTGPVAGKQVTVRLDPDRRRTRCGACRSAPCSGRRSPAIRTQASRTASRHSAGSRSGRARRSTRWSVHRARSSRGSTRARRMPSPRSR